jgi:hypothetical protein
MFFVLYFQTQKCIQCQIGIIGQDKVNTSEQLLCLFECYGAKSAE